MLMKNTIKYLSITLLLSSCFANADALHDQYPVDPNKSIALASGYVVDLPFHTTGTTVGIIGFIDASESKKFVSHSKYKPIDIECNGEKTGKSIGVFYVQDIYSSPVGSYQESVNTMMVQRKYVDTLPLGCIPEKTGDATTDSGNLMNYVLNAFSVLSQATESEASRGKPHKYGFYNDFLELNNQVAVKAGLEIWGYPKILSNVNVSLTDDHFSATIHDLDGPRMVVDLSYSRAYGIDTPLLSIGDNILPEGNALEGNLAQLSGILSTKEGTTGAIRPYVGTFELGESKSRTKLALKNTNFTPIAVLEFSQVRGVALPPYKE
jgi:hypothetical protein